MKEKGFTLIELLVVIVIIGILATISVVTFDGYREKARIAKGQAFSKQVDTHMISSGVASGKRTTFMYNFDEGAGNTVTDFSGLGHHITGPKVTFSTDTPTGEGSSFHFNSGGYSDLVSLLASGSAPVKDFTLAGWVKTPNYTGQSFLWTYGSSSIRFLTNGEVSQEVRLSTGIQVVSTSAGAIEFGNWHHIVTTYDGNRIQIYVDGELKTDQAVDPGNVGSNINYVYSPTIQFGPASKSEVYLDDIRMWPYAYKPQ